MKRILFSGWNFLRFLRFFFGIAILVNAIGAGSWTLAIAGLLLTALPLFNIGCCGTGGCVSSYSSVTGKPKETVYEEVV